jgi:hypothetical protein
MKISGNRLTLVMRVVLIGSLVLVAGLWIINANRQPASDLEYFSEAGHNVEGEFLRFFREHGGLEIFGYPITEEIDLNGRRVQYFQHVRVELHPENDASSRVQLGQLAVELNKGEPRIAESLIPAADDPDRVYFPQTGHTVGPSFLRFFNQRGGVDFFGYPITEDFRDNGRRVQYFQRASLEFYPDRPQGQQVQLGNLGEAHFDAAGLPPELRRPVPARQNGQTETAITLLRVEAAVAKRYAAYPGQQTLHVYVTDDVNRDVSGALVVFDVEYPDASRRYEMNPTDASGHAAITFDLEPAPVARKVVVRVTATFGAVVGTTQTSFFNWE